MGTTSGPLTLRPRSSRKLVGQHGWLANLGGHGKQISRIRHERRGDRAVQMRGPPGFIIERVKDRERRLVEAHGKPGDRARLCHDEASCICKKSRDVLLPTWLCLQFNVKCETRHQRTPFSFAGVSINMYP